MVGIVEISVEMIVVGTVVVVGIAVVVVLYTVLQSVAVEIEQPIRLPVPDEELLVLVERAGQFVTVGAQDKTVDHEVKMTVLVG